MYKRTYKKQKNNRLPARGHGNKQTEKRHTENKWGLTRYAGRLALTGLSVILAGSCAYAAALFDGITAGETGILLRLGSSGEALAAALAILVGGVLLLDYQERKDKRK